MENLEFEITTSSVSAAKEKIAEIRAEFGKEVYIIVKISDDKRNKSFDILNSGMEKFFSHVEKKMGGKE